MTEFLQQVAERITVARRSLAHAQRDGDDYLVQVRTGEIESLERLLDQHDEQRVIELERPSSGPGVVEDPAGVATS
jgi:hypothetical protein